MKHQFWSITLLGLCLSACSIVDTKSTQDSTHSVKPFDLKSPQQEETTTKVSIPVYSAQLEELVLNLGFIWQPPSINKITHPG